MKRKCNSCDREYEAKRPSSKYCGDTCRKRGSRAGSVEIGPDEPASSPLFEATKATLEQAGVVDSPLAQQALELARRMSDPRAMGLSVAPISKELRAVMTEALREAPTASALDELRARRDRKRHAG